MRMGAPPAAPPPPPRPPATPRATAGAVGTTSERWRVSAARRIGTESTRRCAVMSDGAGALATAPTVAAPTATAFADGGVADAFAAPETGALVVTTGATAPVTLPDTSRAAFCRDADSAVDRAATRLSPSADGDGDGDGDGDAGGAGDFESAWPLRIASFAAFSPGAAAREESIDELKTSLDLLLF